MPSTPTLDHIVTDRGDQVVSDTEAIRLLSRRVPAVAFVNNHYAGYAPETVRQLAALTGRLWHVSVPCGMASRWRPNRLVLAGEAIASSSRQYRGIASAVGYRGPAARAARSADADVSDLLPDARAVRHARID
jgi:hypothetical protein